MNIWKLSAGTAAVAGLKTGKLEAPPTTAYIMLGEKCRNNCRFCAQSRESKAKDNLLSRVTWPDFSAAEAVAAVAGCFAEGSLRRACLQVVDSGDSYAATLVALAKLKAKSGVPVCVSCRLETVEEAKLLIAAGADRVSLALDAATPELFAAAKGGDWSAKRRLLGECAKALPGRVSTHLIVGLGETEAEMVQIIAALLAEGVSAGLFAFTPVRGTAWGDRPAPPLGQYRRVQVAHYLLKKNFSQDVIKFAGGRIQEFAVPDLTAALDGGKAFETSGCPDCNRPYYNERPGGVMYNYPRPLSEQEFHAALADCGLKGGTSWNGGLLTAVY